MEKSSTIIPPPVTLGAENLCRAFGHGAARIRVLDGVSLEIEPGKLTLCVGPSGSGKSTLLAALSGLVAPDAGRVLVDGLDLWEMSEKERERFRLSHCGFIFQGFNLFSALTAHEQVMLPLQYMGVPAGEARERSLWALEEVGLSARTGFLPGALSGGEKQRVAIARAMVKRPRIIFADEPTSALDGVNGRNVTRLLRELAHSHQATVFGVTHDPRLLDEADRLLYLEDGRMVKDTGAIHSTRLPSS
jgi:putative ABC transport system ATP-binding protein